MLSRWRDYIHSWQHFILLAVMFEMKTRLLIHYLFPMLIFRKIMDLWTVIEKIKLRRLSKFICWILLHVSPCWRWIVNVSLTVSKNLVHVFTSRDLYGHHMDSILFIGNWSISSPLYIPIYKYGQENRHALTM